MPDSILEKNAFYFSNKPQFDYASFANVFANERAKNEARLKFIMHPSGYFVSETVVIGEDAYIEPNCLVGHNVHIGRKARILCGTVIRDATIGDNFLSNEYAVIGANGFTMVEDELGNKLRIPTLGRVIIGNNVAVRNRITIGEGSVIGMGTIVTKSVGANVTVAGNPAQLL